MLTWHYVTSATYHAGSADQKTADKLFFLSDTGEIYRGTQSFTESCILYTEEPTAKAVGKLYINATTLEGKIWNGSAWTTVIQPVQATLAADDTAKPVSGKAVADYVKDQISAVTGSDGLVAAVAYAADTNKLTVTMADGSSDEIAMDGVAADLVYDKATGLLQVKNASGTTIGTGINLDLERFVSSAEYDEETKEIILNFNDEGEPLKIAVGDLVDTYTAGNTQTVAMTVTGNQFTAEVLLAGGDNLLQKTESGLYVAPVDLSGKMDKDTDAVVGNLAKFDANGNAVDAGLIAGGAALADAPNATTLATEAAVAAIRTALQSAIDGKMNKVEAGKAGEILVATAEGHAEVSGLKAGGAALAENADAATLATEKAVKDHVAGYAVAKVNVVAAGAMATTTTAASDEKVTSEKAVVDAMSWKTTL